MLRGDTYQHDSDECSNRLYARRGSERPSRIPQVRQQGRTGSVQYQGRGRSYTRAYTLGGVEVRIVPSCVVCCTKKSVSHPYIRGKNTHVILFVCTTKRQALLHGKQHSVRSFLHDAHHIRPSSAVKSCGVTNPSQTNRGRKELFTAHDGPTSRRAVNVVTM